MNIGRIPPCKNSMPSWNNQESQTQSMSALLQNSFSLSNLSCNVDYGNISSLVEAVAGWQCRWWWWRWQQHGGSGGGGSLVVTRRQIRPALGQRQQHSGGGGEYQCCKVAAWQHDGGNMRTRDYKVCNYETDDEAELIEENFGGE